MIFSILFVSMLGGFATHFTRRVTNHLQGGWRDLANYTIGVLAMVPFGALMYRYVSRGRDDDERRQHLEDDYAIANLLTALAFGAGVACGKVGDTVIISRSKEE